jgi:hypothetical protein
MCQQKGITIGKKFRFLLKEVSGDGLEYDFLITIATSTRSKFKLFVIKAYSEYTS